MLEKVLKIYKVLESPGLAMMLELFLFFCVYKTYVYVYVHSIIGSNKIQFRMSAFLNFCIKRY